MEISKDQIEKQAIEEMAHIVSNSIMTWANEMPPISNPHFVATNLYNAGYRKQSEGEWVKTGDGITERVICSNCKSEKGSFMRPPFCNQCGAKMKGGAK